MPHNDFEALLSEKGALVTPTIRPPQDGPAPKKLDLVCCPKRPHRPKAPKGCFCIVQVLWRNQPFASLTDIGTQQPDTRYPKHVEKRQYSGEHFGRVETYNMKHYMLGPVCHGMATVVCDEWLISHATIEKEMWCVTLTLALFCCVAKKQHTCMQKNVSASQ